MTPEQKIKEESEKLYPLHQGDTGLINLHNSKMRIAREAYIAGRSAGLEREKEYRELLNIIRDDGGFEWLHSTTREKIEQLLNK